MKTPESIHLKSLTKQKWDDSLNAVFPFSLDVIQSLDIMKFTAPVTFFVGENGSGKSTLLEALACAIGSVTVGSESVKTDPSLTSIRSFTQYIRLSWTKRTHRGFFLRAEDFFGYAKNMRQTRQELESDLISYEKEARQRSDTAAHWAKVAFNNELSAMRSAYGSGLDNRSHGESFMALFQARFVPGGLYLLDEPKAALSPSRQLGFLSAVKEMIRKDSQFIIATHSPVILAFPEAEILSLDNGRIQPVTYDQLEHVTLMRDFLQNPQAFLRHL